VQAAHQRAQKIEAQAAAWKKAPIADAAKFEQLKNRAAQIAKTTKKDTELGKAQLLLRALPSCLLPADSAEQKDAQEQLKTAYAEAHKPGAKK
jgi:hypothetical protein